MCPVMEWKRVLAAEAGGGNGAEQKPCSPRRGARRLPHRVGRRHCPEDRVALAREPRLWAVPLVPRPVHTSPW